MVISSAIFEGRVEFQSHINPHHGWCLFIHSPSFTTTYALATVFCPQLHTPNHSATSPSPLLRDVGSTNNTSAPSEVRIQLQLPLPFLKGCGLFIVTQGRNGGGGDMGGTQEVGGPCSASWKVSHNVCHSSFFIHFYFLPFAPLTYFTLNPTGVELNSYMAGHMRTNTGMTITATDGDSNNSHSHKNNRNDSLQWWQTANV